MAGIESWVLDSESAAETVEVISFLSEAKGDFMLIQ